MKIIDAVQGSDAWAQVRAKHFTASEAPAMMGESKYQTRDQLLRQKSTGERPEVSPAQQALFDRGHAAEAAIRPHIETIIAEELFPVTAIDDAGYLLASFDGITLLGDIIFECKLWNEALAEQVRNNSLEPHYYWQLEQQLLVSGADKAIFVVTDGTPEKTEYCWYEPIKGRDEALMRGWNRFEKDLAEYVPEVIPAKPEAASIEEFPALAVALVGEVKSSNLPVFRKKALEFIESINTDLQTDQDFADAEEAVKFCDKAEKELDMVKKQALAQTSTIDELFRSMDHIRESLRAKRLTLEKLVKTRKEQIKNEIVTDARNALMDELSAANEEFAPVAVSGILADFSGAIKGKRNIESIKSAVNDELARARIALTEKRDHVRKSLKLIREAGEEYRFLFNDIQDLVGKQHDHLQLLVKQRVSDHQDAEQARIEAEAEKRAQAIAREAEQKRAAEEAEKQRQEQVAAPVAKESADAPTQEKQIHGSSVSRMPEKSRPSDDEIIEVLALHYRVHESKVIEWLLELDLPQASDRMVNNL